MIDRLTRRVRSVALRLEAIEDGLDRLEDRLEDAPSGGGDSAALEQVLARLSAIEGRLDALATKPAAKPAAKKASAKKAPAKRAAAKKPGGTGTSTSA